MTQRDGMGEWHGNMCNIIYETSRSPGSKHDTGCLGLVHWDDPEGWYGVSDFQPLLSSIWTLFQGHWAIGKVLIYIGLKPSAQKWPLTIPLPETCISPLLRDFCCYSLHIRPDGLDPKAGTQRHARPVPHSTDVHMSSSDLPCDCLLPLSPLASN